MPCFSGTRHYKEDEGKSEEKRLEDVHVIKDFSRVFPEDFQGLPPNRQVGFQIDLVHGAAPVAQASYRLAPSELQELSNQLLELADKGFIRPIEAFKEENVKDENLCGMDKEFETRLNETRCFMNISWLPRLVRPFYTNERDMQDGEVDETLPERDLGTQLDISTPYHSQTDGQSERTIQMLEDMLQGHVLLISVAPIEALYGRKCRSPVCWTEVGDSQLTGLDIIHETTKKIIQIKNKMQTARDHQIYAHVRRKALEFQVGYEVMLKVLARVGPIAYRLELPQELRKFHSTFHVSNLKKCLTDESLVISLEEIQIDDKLHFVEEPVEIMDQEVNSNHGFVGYPFDYRVTLGFGSIAGGLDHVNPVIRLLLEHGISRVLGKDDHSNPRTMAGVDINTLTMEQYLAFSRENQAPGVVKPEIRGNGLIPGMTPTQALTAIQTMADHSQKWHDGTSSRNVSSNSNTEGLARFVSKLDNIGCDMKKLKENVHAIQVGCQICEGPHLDKECPLNEEVKQLEEVKYREFRRSVPFNGSNGAKFHVGPLGYYARTDNRPPYGEKRPSLEELMNMHQEESTRRSVEMKKWFKKL
ncbi:putative reverse transcriptase domain, ribonuclease H-like domain, aspartic peptidase domain protein [Tanacetum coccineum]